MRIAIAALLLTGCTLVSDLNSQDCETDLDCDTGRTCSANNLCLLTSEAAECVRDEQCAAGQLCASGRCAAEETARWGCAGNMSEAPLSGSEKVTLQISTRIRAGSGTLPPAMVTAFACSEPTCANAVGPFASSSGGVVSVVVDQGFEGFIKLTGSGFIDAYYQLQAPVNADAPAAAELTLLSAQDVTSMAEAAGVEVRLDERGVVVFQVLDCVGDASGDVSVRDLTQDSEVDLVYLAADLNVDSAANATSAAGLAIALDASIGEPEFSLARQSAGTDLGSVKAATVAGAITYVSYQLGR